MKITEPVIKQIVREMKSDRFREMALSPDFIAFADADLIPLLNLDGYKLEKKHCAARHVFHNLVRAGLVNGTVVDSRQPSRTPNLRIEMWDKMVAADLADLVVGSEWSRKDSRYVATADLLNRRERWEQSLLRNVGADGPLVVLTSGDVDRRAGADVPEQPSNRLLNIKEAVGEIAWRLEGGDFDRAVQRYGQIFKTLRYMEAVINQVNTVNCGHHWEVDAKRPSLLGRAPIDTTAQPSLVFRQIHSGALFRAMRLYSVGSPGQNMKRAQRATMRIDGQPTVEPDFKCLHLAMLYHRAGLSPAGDLYRPEIIFPRFHATKPPAQKRELVRDFVKTATLAALNAATFGEAVGPIYKAMEENAELRSLVMDVEGLNSKSVLQALGDAHCDIAGSLFSGAGLWLMTLDGWLMLTILLKLSNRNIPAFPIHDSIRVRASDGGIVQSVMVERYSKMFGAVPKISVK